MRRKIFGRFNIKKDFKTEICSNCHPFYTGKQKLIDSSGRVDKFMAKRKKADDLKAKSASKSKKKTSKEEDVDEVVSEEEEEKEVTTKETPKAKEETPEAEKEGS